MANSGFHRATFLPLCLGVCFLLFFQNLGEIPFYTKGEPREAAVVWEIHNSGEWILPLRNGTEIPSKPPLFHWLGALTAKLFGRVEEWVIRLPSAILGTLGVLLTYFLGARLWEERVGLWAALILATSFEWWRAATTARVDMTLTFFMVAAFAFLLLRYREGRGRRAESLFLALLLGLATLAKGPVGALLPCLSLLFFLWLRKDLAFLSRLHLSAGAVLFLLVAGSWYALALWQGGEQFFTKQILRENLLRFVATEAAGTGHEHPFYYFIPGLFLGMFPWSLFFPALILLFTYHRPLLADARILYLLIWFGTVFLFFSASSGKRTVYILPLYPAVALLLALLGQQLRATPSRFLLRLARWGGYGGSLVFFLLAAILAAQVLGWNPGEWVHPLLHPKDQANLPLLARSVQKHPREIGLWLVLVGAVAPLLVWSLHRHFWERAFACFALLTVATLLLVSHAFHPVLAQERTFKPFMARVSQEVSRKSPLFFYRSFDYGALFYARRHIPRYPGKVTEKTPPCFLLMWQEEWEKLKERPYLSLMGISKGTGPKGNHRLTLVAVHSPT